MTDQTTTQRAPATPALPDPAEVREHIRAAFLNAARKLEEQAALLRKQAEEA